jgi:hypothetical protein
MNGVHNTLCLTGDSYATVPKIKQVFDMDGALMLYEARHLRETGAVHFTGESIADALRPFLGAAINPFTEPVQVPVRRLKQKAAAGADLSRRSFLDWPTLAFMERPWRGIMRTCSSSPDPVVTFAAIPVLPHSGVHPAAARSGWKALISPLRASPWRMLRRPGSGVAGVHSCSSAPPRCAAAVVAALPDQ